MSIVGQEDISFSKQDVQESKDIISTSKTLEFRDVASAGQLIINLEALTTPSHGAFINPTSVELSAANLYNNKKNFRLTTSRGVELVQHSDYIIATNTIIQIIGNIAALGGLEEGEVLSGFIVPIPPNAIFVADSEIKKQSYTLAVGQTVLNLGREYEVGKGLVLGSQVGDIGVNRKGLDQLRNVNNAPAAPSAVGNFHEIDSGNGFGTSIEFNNAPVGQADEVIIEFGLSFSGDVAILGAQQALAGQFYDFLTQAGPGLGIDPADILTASMSEIERRAFGDLVLVNKDDIAALKAQTQTQFDLTVSVFAPVLKAVGIPYKTKNDIWRFKFNIAGTTAALTTIAPSISGVVFGAEFQAITAWDVGVATNTQQARANPGGGSLTITRSAASANWILSGDVELASKPSATFFPGI